MFSLSRPFVFILLYCALVSTQFALIAEAADNAWSILKVDGKVYMSDQPVCKTPSALFANMSSGSMADCHKVPYGSPATVVKVLPRTRASDPDWNTHPYAPYVLIEGKQSMWRGYANASALQPAVPVGTLLQMLPKEGPLLLAACPSYKCHGTKIDERFEAKVLQYRPENRERTLFVAVVSGAAQGKRGWMQLADTDVALKVDTGIFAFDFSSMKPPR